MSIPRGLSEDEAAAWEKLAATVTPMAGRKRPNPPSSEERGQAQVGRRGSQAMSRPRPSAPSLPYSPTTASQRPPARSGEGALDSHWDRRFKAGAIQPDFTLDLHGHSLDTAYDRLMTGLDQAMAMEARVVLLIAGRSRPVDPADRGQRRGAIRAKMLDWLAASRHENSIAAIRRAHIRHGGEGALYLVLKRRR